MVPALFGCVDLDSSRPFCRLFVVCVITPVSFLNKGRVLHVGLCGLGDCVWVVSLLGRACVILCRVVCP